MEPPISVHDYEVEYIFSVDNLKSMERLDRSSPELWPEVVPGQGDFSFGPSAQRSHPDWLGQLNKEDMKLLAALTSMTPTGVVTEVKKLFDAAYHMGCEECRETTRGKILKVLIKEGKKSKVVKSQELEDKDKTDKTYTDRNSESKDSNPDTTDPK